jgi:hypothetical protein
MGPELSSLTSWTVNSWQSDEEHPLKETLEKLTGGTLEVGFHLPREKFVLAVQWQFSPRGEPLLNEGDDLACSHSSSSPPTVG